MGWFSNRKGRRKEKAGEISEGPHRSPGFEEICRFLETEPAYAVLDLGASSTETVELLAELCDDFVVQDVFHSTASAKGVRSEIFRFESAEDVSLPEGRRFDVVLMWDVLHYLAPEERAPFVARMARCCEPGAMVLLIASSIAAIPPEPIHFKALRRDRLDYLLSDERCPSPGLTTREVEKIMQGFMPVRIFQLRNGLQEMVFQIAEAPRGAAEGSKPEVEARPEEAETPLDEPAVGPGQLRLDVAPPENEPTVSAGGEGSEDGPEADTAEASSAEMETEEDRSEDDTAESKKPKPRARSRRRSSRPKR